MAVTAVLIADLYARGTTSRLLRNQPLVAVGRVSYGLYLWHWPVYLVLNGGRIHWGFVPLTVLRLTVSGLWRRPCPVRAGSSNSPSCASSVRLEPALLRLRTP